MSDARDPSDRQVASGIQRWRKPLIRVGIGLLVFCLLFYGGGGWYFSSQLGDDAFFVSHDDDDEFSVEVNRIDADTITLAVPSGDEPTLGTDGVNGFEYAGGRLWLGAVVSDIADESTDLVTREYEVLLGNPPTVGTMGDLDSWIYPDDPAFLFDSAERVTYESPLGAMDAWQVPGTGDTWVILVHGKGATTRETLRMMDIIEPTPMLSISYRNDEGQPEDPSGYYRYGVTEWEDLEAAVAWARGQGANEVVLAGFSTGAAVILSFMYQSELADTVTGIMFDAPNIDFGRTVDFGASQRSLPLVGLGVPQSLTTVAKFIGALRFGVDWSELDYIDDIDDIDVPMLVFHGTEDTTVPPDVSERLAEERSSLVTLHLLEDAEHVQSWNVDSARYEAAVRRFLGGLVGG